MAYDIFFVRRDPGETFEDALEGSDESFDDDEPQPLSSAENEQWRRILRRAREILGPVDVSEDPVNREVCDPATGIELAFLSGEVSLRVADTSSSADSLEIMEKVYALARVVETETGLEGYDPQLGEALSDARADAAGGLLDGSAVAHADGEGRATGGGTAAPARAPDTGLTEPMPDPEPASRPAGTERRWWEFWRR